MSRNHYQKILLFFAPLFLGFFLSCSDTNPKLSTVNPCVIFEFSDFETEPNVRLSVFANTESDIQRVAEIRALNEETGLEWICLNPRKIIDSNQKNWVGYSKFIAPYGENFPSGKYIFYYEDLSGSEYETNFSLNLDDSYFSSKAEDYPNLIKVSKRKKIAIYNETNALAYYGDFRKSWNSEDDAVKDFPDAISYRICYVTSDNKICFVMPFVNISNSENSTNTEKSNN